MSRVLLTKTTLLIFLFFVRFSCIFLYVFLNIFLDLFRAVLQSSFKILLFSFEGLTPTIFKVLQTQVGLGFEILILATFNLQLPLKR